MSTQPLVPAGAILRPDRVVLGVAAAGGAFAVFSAMDAIIKATSASVQTPQLIATLSLVALPLLVLYARLSFQRPFERADFKPAQPRLTLLRGVFGVCSALFAFLAFARLPLADVYALIFISPMVVTVLSVVFLRENVGWRRWTAVILGFVGVLIMVRPGSVSLDIGHLFALLAAIFGGSAAVLMRSLTGREKPAVLMLSTSAMMLLATGPIALVNFVMPSADVLMAMVACGFCLAAGQLLLLTAARNAPANAIAPIQYSQMLWALLLGALFFADLPDLFDLVGFGVILASGLFTLHRQKVRGVALPGDIRGKHATDEIVAQQRVGRWWSPVR